MESGNIKEECEVEESMQIDHETLADNLVLNQFSVTDLEHFVGMHTDLGTDFSQYTGDDGTDNNCEVDILHKDETAELDGEMEVGHEQQESYQEEEQEDMEDEQEEYLDHEQEEIMSEEEAEMEQEEELDPEQELEHDEVEEELEDELEEDLEEEEEENEERVTADEAILPDMTELVKISQPTYIQSPTHTRMIAPKPSLPKLIGNASGQQIFFIQTGGPNQTIRLMSGMGNSPGTYQLMKTSDGNLVQIRQQSNTPQAVLQTGTKKIAPAPLVNKTVSPSMILKKQVQQIALGSHNQGGAAINLVPVSSQSSSDIKMVVQPKTITLAQAQQMGLIRGDLSKMQLVSSTKLGSKSPLKILPAPAPGLSPIKNLGPQKVLIQQGGTLRPLMKQQIKQETTVPGTSTEPAGAVRARAVTLNPTSGKQPAVSTHQVIKIPTGQTINTSQIHQINVPGRGIQYVRLVGTSQVSPATQSQTFLTTKAVTSKAQTQITLKPVATPSIKSTAVKAPSMSIKTTMSGVTRIQPGKQNADITSMDKPIISIVNKNIGESAVNTSSANVQITNAMFKSNKNQNRMIIPASLKPGNPAITTISSSKLNQLPAGATIIQSSSNNMQQLVMVPAQYVHQLHAQAQAQAQAQQLTATLNLDHNKSQITVDTSVPEDSIPSIGRPSSKIKIELDASVESLLVNALEKKKNLYQHHDMTDANGLRAKKPCNCTKSQCLKLYCDCFANGEFCHNCNCKDCYNNIENEEDRAKAIRSCLERNPNAFRPKIGKAKDPVLIAIRRHNKGCNCKRSACLKNYCECYEAKIACSNNCKCFGCRNIEESLERKRNRHEDDSGVIAQKKILTSSEFESSWPFSKETTGNRWPVNFVTHDVIEATCQCLLAQADDAEKAGLDENIVVDQIIEEFGRCLVEIIQCSNRSKEDVKEPTS